MDDSMNGLVITQGQVYWDIGVPIGIALKDFTVRLRDIPYYEIMDLPEDKPAGASIGAVPELFAKYVVGISGETGWGTWRNVQLDQLSGQQKVALGEEIYKSFAVFAGSRGIKPMEVAASRYGRLPSEVLRDATLFDVLLANVSA